MHLKMCNCNLLQFNPDTFVSIYGTNEYKKCNWEFLSQFNEKIKLDISEKKKIK